MAGDSISIKTSDPICYPCSAYAFYVVDKGHHYQWKGVVVQLLRNFLFRVKPFI